MLPWGLVTSTVWTVYSSPMEIHTEKSCYTMRCKISSDFFMPGIQWPTILFETFLDWRAIAGFYCKCSEHLRTACSASEGPRVCIPPCLLWPSAADHHPSSWADAEEGVFILSGDAFGDAVDEHSLTAGLPPWRRQQRWTSRSQRVLGQELLHLLCCWGKHGR